MGGSGSIGKGLFLLDFVPQEVQNAKWVTLKYLGANLFLGWRCLLEA